MKTQILAVLLVMTAVAAATRPRRGLLPYSVRTIHSVVPFRVPHPVVVPIHRPVPVKVVEHIPVAVPRAVPVTVHKPVAVEVPRAVPYPVPRAVGYEVPYGVPRAVPLHFQQPLQFAKKPVAFGSDDITEAFIPTAHGGFKAL